MHNVGRIYILTRASKYPALVADPLTYNSIVRDWHTNVAKALLEKWRVAGRGRRCRRQATRTWIASSVDL
jgi:hypothetical protein